MYAVTVFDASVNLPAWGNPVPFPSDDRFDNPAQGNIIPLTGYITAEKEEPPFFPDGLHLPDILIPVHAGIVEYDKCLFGYPERILFEEINGLSGICGFTGTETFKMVVSVNHSEDIEPPGPLRGYIYVFSGKFPP
jgi:hypothetical protein